MTTLGLWALLALKGETSQPSPHQHGSSEAPSYGSVNLCPQCKGDLGCMTISPVYLFAWRKALSFRAQLPIRVCRSSSTLTEKHIEINYRLLYRSHESSYSRCCHHRIGYRNGRRHLPGQCQNLVRRVSSRCAPVNIIN